MAEQLTLNQLVGSSSLPRLTSILSTKRPSGSDPCRHRPAAPRVDDALEAKGGGDIGLFRSAEIRRYPASQ